MVRSQNEEEEKKNKKTNVDIEEREKEQEQGENAKFQCGEVLQYYSTVRKYRDSSDFRVHTS